MYQTCLFCNKPLGSNEVVEHFPVGRRLAFDEAKGRLWVVCRKCRRWNLTPIEERWEAIEECERFFRATRMRASTENIGIAHHSEGLELVRIGEPLRPEFAAWQYGDQLSERRRQAVRAVVIGVPGGLAAFAVLATLPSLVMAAVMIFSGWPYLIWQHKRTVARVRLGAPAVSARITPDNVARFRLHDLATIRVLPDDSDLGFRVEIYHGDRTRRFRGENARRALEGELCILEQAWKEAEEIAAISDSLLLPAGTDEFLERHGGKASTEWASQSHEQVNGDRKPPEGST